MFDVVIFGFLFSIIFCLFLYLVIYLPNQKWFEHKRELSFRRKQSFHLLDWAGYKTIPYYRGYAYRCICDFCGEGLYNVQVERPEKTMAPSGELFEKTHIHTLPLVVCPRCQYLKLTRGAVPYNDPRENELYRLPDVLKRNNGSLRLFIKDELSLDPKRWGI